jgi:hypothetical protein
MQVLLGHVIADLTAQRFEHEINVWASLKHDHTLPFLGLVTDLGQQIHIASCRSFGSASGSLNILLGFALA